MSWFRSSRRRRKAAESVAAPAGPPRPARADLEQRPLADLHALAAEWGVPRYRLLRRDPLIEAISGEPAAAPVAQAEPAPAPAPRPAPVREPEPAPEPQPEPLPEPEPAGESRSGFLDLVGEGYGFLRIHGLARSSDDPYVPREVVRKFSLRRGEELSGRVVPRRAGERHAARLADVEWRRAEPPPTSFEDSPVQPPSRALQPRAGTDAFAPRMTELVATLAIGQRALVAGPPGAGATQLLRATAGSLIGGEERLIVVLVDARPEEVPGWELSEQVEVHAAPDDRAPREQVALAELVLERAKRLAEQGEDVIVVLDSISRLARAYGLAGKRQGDDGPTPELLGVEGAKQWFGAARDTGSGSLTLLAAGRSDSDSALEALVHETLLDMAGTVVRLDPELAARGLYPAIDARASYTRGEELLLSEDERRHRESMRGVMRSLEPAEAWEFAAARARELGAA